MIPQAERFIPLVLAINNRRQPHPKRFALYLQFRALSRATINSKQRILKIGHVTRLRSYLNPLHLPLGIHRKTARSLPPSPTLCRSIPNPELLAQGIDSIHAGWREYVPGTTSPQSPSRIDLSLRINNHLYVIIGWCSDAPYRVEPFLCRFL